MTLSEFFKMQVFQDAYKIYLSWKSKTLPIFKSMGLRSSPPPPKKNKEKEDPLDLFCEAMVLCNLKNYWHSTLPYSLACLTCRFHRTQHSNVQMPGKKGRQFQIFSTGLIRNRMIRQQSSPEAILQVHTEDRYKESPLENVPMNLRIALKPKATTVS